MTAFDPLNDRLWVYSEALSAHCEVTGATLTSHALAAGANITLTLNAATGVTTIASTSGGLATVAVDGTTITGNGTPGNPLIAHAAAAGIVVDGVTVTGNGTGASPLVAHLASAAPAARIFSISDNGTDFPVAESTYTNQTNWGGAPACAFGSWSGGTFTFTTAGLYTVDYMANGYAYASSGGGAVVVSFMVYLNGTNVAEEYTLVGNVTDVLMTATIGHTFVAAVGDYIEPYARLGCGAGASVLKVQANMSTFQIVAL